MTLFYGSCEKSWEFILIDFTVIPGCEFSVFILFFARA